MSRASLQNRERLLIQRMPVFDPQNKSPGGKEKTPGAVCPHSFGSALQGLRVLWRPAPVSHQFHQSPIAAARINSGKA